MIKSTHEGELNLGGPNKVSCYVLEDGSRVLVASQIQGVLGASKNRHLDRQLARLDHGSGTLQVRPISFLSPNGEAVGYTAEDVIQILRAYQRAFLRGTLHPKQEPIARAAMAAIETFAEQGLQALIDEAAGFVDPTSKQARFVRVFREKLATWELCFDSDWDREFCRLYGYEYKGRPPVFVRGINAMVYRLAFGASVHAEMVERNPEPQHHSNHHQMLTPEAKIVLSQHIATIKGIAKLSRGPHEFLQKIGVVYKDAPLQLELCA